MIFQVAITRFETPERLTPNSANFFRGVLGAVLHRDMELYRKCFDPGWASGPSGYRNAPRPFVLRHRERNLELITFSSESHNTFVHGLLLACPMEIQTAESLTLDAAGKEWSGRARLAFISPTALKSGGAIAEKPEFKILLPRLAERISALGRLYQEWPASLDLSELAHAAARVELLGYEWNPVSGERRQSARSGHSHDLRGYTGWAEYAGPLGRLMPLLEIGRYTGVGRNTVWGNGEIRIIESSIDQ